MKKEECYIFDVDGTLTRSRGVIDEQFHEYLLNFAESNDIYLVTGSDRQKTIEQIGVKLYDKCLGVYQCNGNELWYRNRRIKTNPWKPSYELEHFLKNKIHHSRYPFKTDNHIEVRTGMVNVSTVGRAADKKQRKDYYDWDRINLERKNLCDDINRKFKDLHATAGGEISIDIAPKKADKSQAAYDLYKQYEFLTFFGDKCDHGGNDYSIALVIELGKMGIVHRVKSWEDTFALLRTTKRLEELGYENKKQAGTTAPSI